MNVKQIRREYLATLWQLREQGEPRTHFICEDGGHVTVSAVRHYCDAMQVLFLRIRELEKLLQGKSQKGT